MGRAGAEAARPLPPAPCAPSPHLISGAPAGGGLGREAAAAQPYCRCAGAAESAAAAPWPAGWPGGRAGGGGRHGARRGVGARPRLCTQGGDRILAARPWPGRLLTPNLNQPLSLNGRPD